MQHAAKSGTCAGAHRVYFNRRNDRADRTRCQYWSFGSIHNHSVLLYFRRTIAFRSLSGCCEGCAWVSTGALQLPWQRQTRDHSPTSDAAAFRSTAVLCDQTQQYRPDPLPGIRTGWREQFQPLCGTDALALPALSIGSRGRYLATRMSFRRSSGVSRCISRRRSGACQAEQVLINQIRSVLKDDLAHFKAALELQGMKMGKTACLATPNPG